MENVQSRHEERPSRQHSDWKQIYQEALFELDPKQMRHKLNAALIAVDHCLYQALLGDGTGRELMELQDAKRTIQFLERQECQS
jgi:hypothetical protein